MLDSKEIVEKKFNKETKKFIGKVQLQHYGNFLEGYIERIHDFKDLLQSKLPVTSKPIAIEIQAKEDITLLQLVHSNNKLLSRILISLGSLCEEIHLLVTEANDDFYNAFIYYGEVEENGGYQHLGKLCELLQKVEFYVNRSCQVVNLMLKQLCAILKRGYYTGSVLTVFPEPLGCVSSLMVSLITLDLLLTSSSIKDNWAVYRRTVHSAAHNPMQYNSKHEDVRALDKKLIEMEAELLCGNIFQNTIEKSIDEHTNISIKNCNLSNEIGLYIQQLLNELERDEESIYFNKLWLQANALLVLHHFLNSHLDKKLTKRLLDINKKVSACIIAGNVLWYPEQFLLKHIPSISKLMDVKVIIVSRSSQLAQRSQGLTKETNVICMQACAWMIEIAKIIKKDMSKFNIKELQDVCTFLVQGIRLVTKISDLIKWITNLHAVEERPMTKSDLLALCKLVEVLKCFQFLFQRSILPLSYVIQLINQHLTHKALTVLTAIKKSVTQEKTYKEQHLDVLSAIVVAEKALKGPNTKQRLLVAKLALSSSGLQNENLAQARSTINRMELFCDLLHILNKLTNCSFLYWHQVLFPIYFTKLVENRVDLMKCYLIMTALTDCVDVGTNAKTNTEKYLQKNLLAPLNQTVETNLRLQTHLHLHLPPSNPFQSVLPRNFKKNFPIHFANTFINIKHEVEHYLSTMFYNLTTVVLHDWKTYGEMRQLAVLQCGLHTVEDNLPVQTLNQGLDVLEIMRNINVFVGNYLYNLNNQFFVEQWGSNKHLNTINISHIANSIRTHGIGIMSTTVNFTYQFLQNKFFIFSQFMFDEHIKSRLLKDLRFFSEHKTELNQHYPYARAEKFNFGIRKLGLNEQGLTYLDLFRKLITQIGNAMGYVRLIRAGGKRCVADATCFLPDLKAIEELNTLIDEANLPELAQNAAQSLKRDINNLVDNFEEATEYFKLLINVFAPKFRDPQNIHLRNFYMIIPPLTINFIEHSLTCKENLNKKNREGSAFTDDGFAMGLAYIVELLDQGSHLNSLHWFQSVAIKQNQDKIDLEQQKGKSSKEDVKLQQTLSLTEKRIKAVETEFKLLYYSFSSARIFFQP